MEFVQDCRLRWLSAAALIFVFGWFKVWYAASILMIPWIMFRYGLHDDTISFGFDIPPGMV